MAYDKGNRPEGGFKRRGGGRRRKKVCVFCGDAVCAGVIVHRYEYNRLSY